MLPTCLLLPPPPLLARAAGTMVAASSAGSASVPPPLREGHTHMADSTTPHCFITVDLDLNSGFVRFFRNGHLIVSAFTAVAGPVSPCVSFVQAPNLNCQVGFAACGADCSTAGDSAGGLRVMRSHTQKRVGGWRAAGQMPVAWRTHRR